MSIKTNKVEILKADDEKRIVYGIVLKPDVPDSHDDIMTEEEIEKSAHNYLMFHRTVGEQHMEQADAVPCESYIVKADCLIEGREVKKGTWVVAMKVFSDTLWLKIKDKQFNAFSAGGYAKKENQAK